LANPIVTSILQACEYELEHWSRQVFRNLLFSAEIDMFCQKISRFTFRFAEEIIKIVSNFALTSMTFSENLITFLNSPTWIQKLDEFNQNFGQLLKESFNILTIAVPHSVNKSLNIDFTNVIFNSLHTNSHT
jgi:hypothetical protein